MAESSVSLVGTSRGLRGLNIRVRLGYLLVSLCPTFCPSPHQSFHGGRGEGIAENIIILMLCP